MPHFGGWAPKSPYYAHFVGATGQWWKNCRWTCRHAHVVGLQGGNRHALALLVIRRGFGCGPIGFAQRKLLILLSLLFLGPCARCPLSFSPVSTVIWLECHWILLCGRLISYLPTIYMHLFGLCLSLLFARLGLFPRQR